MLSLRTVTYCTENEETPQCPADAFERTLIEDSLRKHQGNWAATARELKMDRANLARLAQRLGIRTVEAVSKARLQRN